MQLIICEAFHDVNCLKLAKCIPQFCLDLAPMIKSLSPQSHLQLWANKDHVANLLSTEDVEQEQFYFLARNSGREKAE